MKYFNDGDSWYLGEEIPDIDLFFAQIWLSCFTNEFKDPGGRAYKKIMTLWRGYHLWFYYGEKDSYEVGEHLVKKIIKNPDFASLVNKKIIAWSDKLRYYAENLPEENLDKLTNKELWYYYKKHDEIHTAYYQWGWLPVAADMFHNNLTERLKRHLHSLGVGTNKINEYLVTLTQPINKSLIQIEQEEFLHLALLLQHDKYHRQLFGGLYKIFQEQDVTPYGLATHTPEYEKMLEQKIDEIRDRIKPHILKLVQNYYQKYYYVKFMWIGKGGINNFDYYLKELIKFIGRGQNAERLLKQKRQELASILIRRQQLIKKLHIRGKWRTIFNSWGDFMVTKIYRRYAQIYAIYRMQPILREIGLRLGINALEARFMLKTEVKKALLDKKMINKANLKQRTKFCVYYVEKDLEQVLVGKRAKKMIRGLETKSLDNIKEIKGQTGCIGKATGKVKIIIRPADMIKMNKGDILVSIATDPDIVPAMKKAAAIVTEQGGVTSHAAIVARELNIPCVIGTKIATKVLKDNDLIEVDANSGLVKLL